MNGAKINDLAGFLRIALAPDCSRRGPPGGNYNSLGGGFLVQRFEKELSLYRRFKLCLEGVSRMPHSRRPWSEDELGKLKSMAGKLPAEEIAAELGRSPAAINVAACKQGVSLTHAAPSFWPVRYGTASMSQGSRVKTRDRAAQG